MSDENNRNYSFRRGEGDLVIAQGTFLGRLVGSQGVTSSGRRSWLYHLLFAHDGLAKPLMWNLWNNRFGGLILYGLGVRTTREMDRVARARRQRRR